MYKHYSQEIAKAVLMCLSEEKMDFEYCKENGTFCFRIGLPGKIKILPCIIHIHGTGFTVRGLIPADPISGNTDKMQQMNDFVNRANDCLTNRNYEFDCTDRGLRYRVHVNCRGLLAPTNDMILNSIYGVAAMCARDGERSGKNIFSEMSSESAIALCRQNDGQRPSKDDDDVLDDLTDAEDNVFDAPGDEYVLEIVDNEKDFIAATLAGNGAVSPQFSAFDGEDISDILRKLREMREDD